jgi:proline utilization trans-activator
MGFSLLDEMIARGSQVARMRKSEIELLEELIQPLQRPSLQVRRERPNDTPHRPYLETPLSQEREAPVVPHPQHPSEVNAEPVMLPDPGEEELLFDWRDFGMSLNQMLSATDQLNADPAIQNADGSLADMWLWSDG